MILRRSQRNEVARRTVVVHGVALSAAALEELLSVVNVSRRDLRHF